MPDNAKLFFDRSRGRQEPESEPDSSPMSGPLADTEAQMRRALGLNGGNLFRQKQKPKAEQERPEPQASRPTPDRFGQDRFGAAPRRRFVQDGDIPVTVLRREQHIDMAAARAAVAGPAPEVVKLQDDLGQERANREKAEKALAEAQATIRDLRNKLGFADLAKTEAEEQARKLREASAATRQAAHDAAEARKELEDRVRAAERELATAQGALEEERAARKQAEKALKASEEAREEAERLVRVLSTETAAPVAARKPAAPRKVKVLEEETVAEGPEPVKWWLASGKKR